MAEKRDYYEVLGIPKTATEAEIKKAFRTTAKKYHPDMHPGDKECEEKFKEAQEAYAVLSDPEKRRQYDQFGHAAFDGGAGGAGGFDFSGMDMGDIFGDIFGDFFGGGRRNSNNNGPAQGASVRLTVRITFEEAVFGCSKELEFPYKEERKTVEIPAGIDNGQSVRVRGYGEPGRNGGPRGDLLVEVLVSRSNAFERQDMNIFSNASISFGIAALGGDIRIRTVDGDIIYTVAPGTQSGTRIRLKGKGVPSIRNKAVRGDHYVTLIVNTPTGLNKEAKEALRKFDELTGNSLNKEGGAQTAKEKKKGFMDKIKESFDEH